MIPDVLIYLLKANAALLLLLGLYYALLRRLTFHQLNRVYLLGAGVFSMLYPLLDVSALLVRPVQLGEVVLPAWAMLVGAAGSAPASATGPDYGLWLLGLYWSGVGFMLLRLLLQGASLAGVHRASRPAIAAGVPFRQVAAEVNPFSFWQTIYLNPEQHGATELPAILLHEQVHVRQWHTLDVLLVHLQRILGWFSPGTWLLLRAVQENLEFITDEEVLRAGRLDARQYQYSLVRLSTLAPGPALVTPFSFITLKNRIQMMNSHASSRKQTARYLLVLPLVLSLLSFSAPEAASAMLTPKSAVAPAGEDVEKATTISALPPAALAHIVKQYPGYRLIGVSELRAADGSNLRYKAEIAIGRRPKQVVFTEKGEPVAAVVAEPLYYVDGKLTPKSEVDKLDPKSIESMKVLKGEAAHKVFGDQAVDGVVVITTKANVNSRAVRAFNQKVEAAAPTKKTDMSKALILLNGKEITEAEMKQIPSSTIKEVRVVNDAEAEKQYGAKGRNGVIIVTTK
ncbi:M56 family metallopeptidase [Hymenobacter sp. BT730]|uniref:M56 family metallopeptidase n=1 Tax=Hymenobacter sp. BT730 TaxID=3063332 RepID=UPI0026E0CEBD|nr:M56 family metallopeptidase [Hymenobacter sp. BT730]